MTREDKIYDLKSLIRDYENTKDELSDMIYQWNKYDDSGADPGLQYEKELEVDKKYQAIINHVKDKM